jgi:hypothetical protein
MVNNNLEDYNNILLQLFKKEYISKIPIHKLLHTNFKYELSSINRILKIVNMMSTLNINKTKMICTVLKINRQDKLLNYAYVYGYLEENIISNIYILNSPSLISKDGEYRHRLIPYNVLDTLKKNNIYNYFYNYLSNEFQNKEFDLSCEIFNLYENDILDKYKQNMLNSNVLLNIYLISWLTEIFNLYNHNQEINLNELINNILFSNKDITIFTNFYNNNKNEIKLLINSFSYYDKSLNLELGQKIIPFNYIQLKDYKNIIHHQWKELLINKIVLNLILNVNTPCFAIFGDWFLITNSNKNLFDNEKIFNKLFYSEKIKNILNYLYLVKNDLIILDNQDNNIITTLVKKLKKLINISEENLLMSNVSICYLSEYTGKTIYDYFNKIIDKNNINNNIGNLYEDYDIFKKYIFEIIYSLYCLNLKGVIHGDLHLNNITFNIQKYSNNNDNNIMYNINENNHNNLDNSYIFKHYGCYPCIIDFSRSYIFLKSIDEDIIEKEKNKIRNKFISHEKKRIINELNKIFPNYIKNNYHKIKFLLKNTNFEILFNYFSVYDIFTFSTNLLIFLRKISIQKNINVNNKIIDLLNNISKKSYHYLEQIIIEENYDNSRTHKFPNYLLLEEFFKDHLVNTNEINNINITDIFSIYDIDKYHNYKQIKLHLSKIINNIDNSNITENIKNKIIQFTKQLEKNTESEKLDIEKIINNEYYKIKSNLLLTIDTISNSLNESTESFSIDNI